MTSIVCVYAVVQALRTGLITYTAEPQVMLSLIVGAKTTCIGTYTAEPQVMLMIHETLSKRKRGKSSYLSLVVGAKTEVRESRLDSLYMRIYCDVMK
jgi:hypothetical protein